MKKIIHDWKTTQIRSKTSLLKGKKRIAMLVTSGTDESGKVKDFKLCCSVEVHSV